MHEITYKCCVICPGFPGGPSRKEPTCQYRKHKRCRFNPWVWKIPWRRAQQQSPVFLPGESHGQRSLVGYGPQGLKQSDVTSDIAHNLPRSHNSLGGTVHKEQTWNWNPDHLGSQALARFTFPRPQATLGTSNDGYCFYFILCTVLGERLEQLGNPWWL